MNYTARSSGGANIEFGIGKPQLYAWLRHWQADLIDLKNKINGSRTRPEAHRISK